MSQTRDFLKNYLTQVPFTPNQQRTHGLRDEVLARVGAQDMDTSEYQVSGDVEEVEFYWEIDQLDVDAVCRPGIATPFSTTSFDDLEMGGSAENTILLDDEGDKENSSPTTPVSERRTRPQALLGNLPFGTRIKNVLDIVFTNLFQLALPCLCFNIKYN